MGSWYGFRSIKLWKGACNPLNAKKNGSKAWLWCLLFLLVVVPLVILLIKRMEGTPPVMVLKLASPSLGASQTLSIDITDAQSGLRQVWAAILKDGKETVLLDKSFPPANILMGGAFHEQTVEIPVEPKALGLTDGKAILRIVARDYSWRRWGKGNQQYQEHNVIIDTHAPTIDVISPALYISQGGAGVVIYQLSEACPTSGVTVGEDFYPGFEGQFKKPNVRIAFIALNYQQGSGTQMAVTATDYAGNQGRVGLARHIKPKAFRQDTIPINDSFLSWKMPEFADQVDSAPNTPMIETFLKVNRELRRRNYEQIVKITAHSDSQMHWDGAFIRLPGSANRAGYADHRTYTYKGKTIDKETHLGADLASLENSPVPAANAGRVAYAGPIGIYGRTVIIDHGLGLFSLYAHLSKIDATVGQVVAKGDPIGITGKTGLAGGDHLHFSVLVGPTFVNPVEWWDLKWIQDNILTKINAAK
jgi:murein DD-endopeptidase MepM/ murein hydrolase activator NlpD